MQFFLYNNKKYFKAPLGLTSEALAAVGSVC